jgi:anti-sigma regulatory factor (Ser/Thr protein kinase)
MAHLNDALRRREDDLSLCSVVIVLLDDRTGDTRVLSAGHPLPLRRGDTSVTPLGRVGPLLGAVDEPDHPVAVVRLEAGEDLLLYTDGVTDAVGEHDRFGEHRLRRVMAEAGADVVGAVGEALDDFLHGPQPDDIAIVALARHAVPADPSGAPSGGTWHLPADPASIAFARQIAGEVAEGLMEPEQAAQLRLLVSEVVTNAIKHSGSQDDVVLTLARKPQLLSVQVTDHGPGLVPSPGAINGGVEGAGFGLFLVEQAARRWGVTREAARTRVWFELDLR